MDNTPPHSRSKAPQVVGTYGFAMEGCHPNAETEKHSLDLMMESLTDGEAAGGLRQQLHSGRLGTGVFLPEWHSRAEGLNGFLCDADVGFYQVGLWNLVLRPGEVLGKGAVICKDNEPGG